jgi:hypothetical protein
MSNWTGEYSDTHMRQLIVNMQVCGTLNLLPQVIIAVRVLPSQQELSQPKHDMAERVMMLAENMRPEATLCIGFS